jgi:signal transduction histidine kinase
MAHNPLSFLFSAWPWRVIAYLVGSVLIASTLWWVILPGLLFPPALMLLGIPVGALERRRLRFVEATAPPTPHATVTQPGLSAWLGLRYTELSTWRELAYTACMATVLLIVDLTALFFLFLCALLLGVPLLVALDPQTTFQVFEMDVDTVAEGWLVAGVFGVPATVLTVYGMTALAGAQAAFTRWLLAPTSVELARQVDELARSRTRLVDAFEAERRRIERDLHDGAQQHLVLLTMSLGLAELELSGPHDDPARALVGDAHRQARQALHAMRDVIHGIHPQILTDLGLRAAVEELAMRCTVAVAVDIDLYRRLPTAVESTAYFVVSEALTNAVRHAEAQRIAVTGRLVDDHLVMAVTDDGVGGANPTLGTGLRGLSDRVAVLAGTLTLQSPLGGPTTLAIDLPCRSG